MTSRFSAPIGLLLLFAIAIQGCGRSSTAPTDSAQTQSDDIAVQVGQWMARDAGGSMALIAAAGASAGGQAPQTRIVNPNRTPVASETTFVIGGVTVTLTRAFYDIADQELSGYGPTATRMAATSRITGTVSTARMLATVGHAGTLDVRGLLASEDTLRFNGGAQDTLQARFQSLDASRTRYFYAVSTVSLNELRKPKSSGAAAWPVSGVATWTISADRLRSNDRTDVERHFEAVVVVVFDGTQQVDVTVDGTYRYRLDLATGAVVRAA